MWKFKSWKGKDKCLFLLTIGVMLCILAFPAEGLARKNGTGAAKMSADETDTEQSNAGEMLENRGQESAPSSASYETLLENRVRELLKHVDGVGVVDVMIVLKSTSEKVLHVDASSAVSSTQETDSSGGSRSIESREQEQSAVLLTGSGQSQPIVEKELYPELSGIIISAAGGGNPTVRAEISAAMEALFGLPQNKIKVLKRAE